MVAFLWIHRIIILYPIFEKNIVRKKQNSESYRNVYNAFWNFFIIWWS